VILWQVVQHPQAQPKISGGWLFVYYVERLYAAGALSVRKLLANRYAVLGRAAYSLGDIKRARFYARQSIAKHPFRWDQWCFFTKTVVVSLLPG
jgi:hypothetical protein